MSNPIRLAISRQSKTLVPYNGSSTSIPDQYQSNVQDLIIQIVDETGSLKTPYTVIDMSDYGLRVSVGNTPTGDSGGPTPLTLQDTFPWDSANKWFVASLPFNVAAVDMFIGSLPSKAAFFEVNTTLAGVRNTLLQTNVLLRAVVDEGTTTAPTPTDSYLTKAESLATFPKKKGDPGQTQVFVSPSGAWGLEIGIDDTGTPFQNIIPNP